MAFNILNLFKKKDDGSPSIVSSAISGLASPGNLLTKVVSSVTKVAKTANATDYVKKIVESSRKQGLLNDVVSALGGKKYTDPTLGGALGAPSTQQIRDLALPTSAQMSRSISNAADKERATETFASKQGILGSFNYLNQTPAQRLGSAVTAPIRLFAGSLARLTVSFAAEVLDADVSYIPQSRLQESLVGRAELKRVSESDDIYGTANNLVKQKLLSLGVSEKSAKFGSLSSVLILGSILENPFMGPGKAGAKEALEKGMKEYIQTGIGRELDEPLIKRISEQASALAGLDSGARQAQMKSWLADVEAETLIKRGAKQRKDLLAEADRSGALLKNQERTGTPSNMTVANNLPNPGLETKPSPSLTSIREAGAASKSTRYTSPSHLINSAELDIHKAYTISSKLSQANKAAFKADIEAATGVKLGKDAVRIKGEESFLGKVERYKLKGKAAGDISDVLAARVTTSEKDIYSKLSNIQESFEVVDVSDYFKDPSKFGYRGLNVTVRLPGGQLAEIQIHTPASLEAAGPAHKLYEKWRNKDVSLLSDAEIAEYKADMKKSNAIFETAVTNNAESSRGEDFYAEILAQKKAAQGSALVGRVKTAASHIAKAVAQQSRKTLEGISYRLSKIDPELKASLRTFEFDLAQNTIDDLKVAEKFGAKVQGYVKGDDAVIFEIAAKNGDTAKMDELAEKYNFKEELAALRAKLDDVYKRASDAGYSFNYQKGYMPRMVKDSEGLLNHFYGSPETKSLIEEAIKEEQNKLGRYLNIDEKAAIANTLIRGYQKGGVTLSKKGAMKERTIDFVGAELDKFYYPTLEAIARYTRSMNEAIAAKKYFGGAFKSIAKTPNVNIQDTIGGYTARLIAEGKISPLEELELRDILNARFAPMGPGKIVGVFRDISYIDTMGSFSSAVSQLQDLAISFYRAGAMGSPRVVKNLAKSLAGLSDIQMVDLGLEKVAEEMTNPGALSMLLNGIFKVVGITKLDRTAKETFVNTVIDGYRKLAKGPLVNRGELYQRLDKIYPGNLEAQERVIQELRGDILTDDIKYVAFNEILDVAPVALSEMPERYLRGGGGRIFYMLKSYQLKQFEVFRREAFDLMKTDPQRGLSNLFKLATAYMLMGATADEIKALMFNRESALENPDMWKDRAVDGALRLMGISKYSTYKAREGDLKSFVTSLLFPPTGLFDNAIKDVNKLLTSPDIRGDLENAESAKSIPVVGKMYYWWFGKGSEKTEEQRDAALVDSTVERLMKISETDKDRANAEFNDFKASMPQLAEKVNRKIQDEKLGLTAQEKRLKSEGVANGERARIVYEKLKRLKTTEEKKALWAEYEEKKIITSEVGKQVKELLKQDGTIPVAN